MKRFTTTMVTGAVFAVALGAQAADEQRGQKQMSLTVNTDDPTRTEKYALPPAAEARYRMAARRIVRNGLLATMAFVVGCTLAAEPSRRVEITLAPGKVHEECMDLQPGQQLRYAFDAKPSLDFNVHYHQGSEVVSPVEQRDVASGKGVFKPATKQHYCMMWSSAAKEPSAVSYEFRVE